MLKELNKQIIKELNQNPIFAKFKSQINNEAYEDVKYYQKKYKFNIDEGEHDTWNNESDAFKHAFSSAWLSLKHNNIYSKLICHPSHNYNNGIENGHWVTINGNHVFLKD